MKHTKTRISLPVIGGNTVATAMPLVTNGNNVRPDSAGVAAICQ